MRAGSTPAGTSREKAPVIEGRTPKKLTPQLSVGPPNITCSVKGCGPLDVLRIPLTVMLAAGRADYRAGVGPVRTWKVLPASVADAPSEAVTPVTVPVAGMMLRYGWKRTRFCSSMK